MIVTGDPSPHRWNEIRKLPMYPEIRSLDDYEEAVSIGTGNAMAFLKEINVLESLRIDDLRKVHFLIFQRVHPWAGDFRSLGQLATVSGFPAADPQRVSRELVMALTQTGDLMREAEQNEDGFQWLAALAFFHIRFERIHPFRDGNGRSGRALLNEQCAVAFGHYPSFSNQTAYRAGLRAASHGDLAPMMNLLGAGCGLPAVPEPWPARFRLAPRFLEESDGSPSLLDDLTWSRCRE